ncbi:hypothetical protein [Methylobacterium aquaticum]|uniref:hypothetical protein n=1 Tax=Methylobacterium aquaticum TaxID=270351 RepID=UPI0019344292|nr:hypothetical protein [Methylobacterium aquaticum]QRE76994.1 hypothetical protein F1D61_28670 [Methylobacterium aquaticum]
MSLPYENATSGASARAEATKILRRFGCDQIGFMDDFATHTIMLQFRWRGHPVEFRVSAGGWAALYLKANPWNSRRRGTAAQWERAALEKGLLAADSIIRDWVKGNVTAVESGALSFGHVFAAYLLDGNGRPLIGAEAVKLLEDRS